MESFDLRKCYLLKDSLNEFTEPLIIDQIAIDSRRISSRNALFVALCGLHFDGHDFIKQAYKAGASVCIVKQGITLSQFPSKMKYIQVADPLKALQHIAACYRNEMRAKIIAITGSHGKTMLKDLLEQLLSTSLNTYSSPESFNSQLGVALSILQIEKKHDVAIIEAGISKQNEMASLVETIKPDHVIVTNIGSAHMESLGTRECIAEEKMKLLSLIPINNWCLIPSDPIITRHLPKRAQCYFWDTHHPHLPKVIPKQIDDKASLGYEIIFPNGVRNENAVPESLMYVLDLVHMATKAAHLLGIPAQTVSERLSAYIPEPMRIELWKTQVGATVINDTYCADPMSCDLAMKQFDSEGSTTGRRIFLFSGVRNDTKTLDIDMQRIAHAIAKHRVDICIVTEHKGLKSFFAAVNLLSPHTDVVVKMDLKAALIYVKDEIRPEDTLVIKGAKKQRVNDLIAAIDESLPNNQVIINLAAIQSNIEMMRVKLPKDTRLMVMVKALAYGTDDVRIAKFLHNIGVDILGVSYVDEGVSMRQAGVKQSIFVLNAAEYEAQKAVKWNLEIGVSEPSLIRSLQAHAQNLKKMVRVHLHVDTGMNRFGCKQKDAVELARLISTCDHLIFEGLMTHFTSADTALEDSFTMQQACLLDDIRKLLETEGLAPKWIHACNSSASIRFQFSQFNMVRIGLAAYGLHASHASKELLELKPAISLVSRIVGINTLSKGETISYGRTHVIEKEMARIAVLPIGYFDGLHRNYSGKANVLIRGKPAKMVGRICMDYMMVDITDIRAAAIGDPVLVFGEDEVGHYLSPEELALQGGSIVHELMTCLGPRIRRLFIYDEALRPR